MMQLRAMLVAAAAGTILVAGGAGQPEKQPGQPGQPSQPDRKPIPQPDNTRQPDKRMMNEPMTINFDRDTPGKAPAGWKVVNTRTDKPADKSEPRGIEPRKPGEPELPGGPGPDKPGAPEEKPTTPQKPGEQPAAPGRTDQPDMKSPDTGDRSGWQVTADPTAPSAPNILQLASPRRQVNGYNLIICERHNMADADLTTKMRAETGAANQGGGLAWRIRDGENFYACSYNPVDGKLRAFRVSNGRSTEIGSADFKGSGPDASTWYTLGARMNGDAITCSINGQELLHTRDTAIKDSGRIGLWARGDAAGSFDDVTVNKSTSMPAPDYQDTKPKTPNTPETPR